MSDIVHPNTKGQIVIPKKIRDKYDIQPGTPLVLKDSGSGIYLSKEQNFLADMSGLKERMKELQIQVLKSTKGSWGPETEEDIENQKQQEIEEKKSMEDNEW